MLCYEKNRGTLTVRLTGELDQRCAGQVRRELDELILDPRVKHLVFDLDDLSFMDSSGIGLIMGRYRAVGLVGGVLKIKNIPDNLTRIIELSGVTSLGVL